HPAIQAFLEVCQKERISAGDIESVSVGMSAFSISHAGKIVIPDDELGAQFSTSFTLALSLIDGEPGMWSYTSSALTNKNILALARKISVFKDEEANSEFPKKNGCVINVRTTKGLNFTARIKDPKGSPEKQLTSEDVKEKFLRNV